MALPAQAGHSGVGPIAVGGDSAGGNLTLGTDQPVARGGRGIAGLRLAGLAVDRPHDVRHDAWTTRDAFDPLIHTAYLTELADAYPRRHPSERRDPLISPLFADLAGFPPILIQVGSAETLLADASARRPSSSPAFHTGQAWIMCGQISRLTRHVRAPARRRCRQPRRVRQQRLGRPDLDQRSAEGRRDRRGAARSAGPCDPCRRADRPPRAPRDRPCGSADRSPSLVASVAPDIARSVQGDTSQAQAGSGLARRAQPVDQSEREPAAGAVAADRDVCRRMPCRAGNATRPAHPQRGRKGMLGREPVADASVRTGGAAGLGHHAGDGSRSSPSNSRRRENTAARASVAARRERPFAGDAVESTASSSISAATGQVEPTSSSRCRRSDQPTGRGLSRAMRGWRRSRCEPRCVLPVAAAIIAHCSCRAKTPAELHATHGPKKGAATLWGKGGRARTGLGRGGVGM